MDKELEELFGKHQLYYKGWKFSPAKLLDGGQTVPASFARGNPFFGGEVIVNLEGVCVHPLAVFSHRGVDRIHAEHGSDIPVLIRMLKEVC